SFMIVVLGGFGSLFGALVGGLAIGVLEELSALLVNPALKDAIAFGIFILILLFKPTGLFGGRET
ncbi:branched-chain amino acid ABC transporter permease, partial [archaeon]